MSDYENIRTADIVDEALIDWKVEVIFGCVATSEPGAIHLLTGLYDAKSDNAPVIAITGSTYSDMMG